MRADYIKDIIESYDKSPYKCILISGPWGVGKSYAINEMLGNKSDACHISMFGMRDAQKIYHEVFFQLVMKDKYSIRNIFSKVERVAAFFSNKISVVKSVIESLVQEKELFLKISETFNKIHYIVIDDMERMNENIRLEEVFGIIDELKKCNYVKIILVANIEQLSQQDIFKKYSEKVIDRTYYITERPGTVEWRKLGIHHDFIEDFLSKHHVKNLRTLQKAQNLYDDVRLKLINNYKEEYYDEIRLVCYAIVVETIENLYEKKLDNTQDNETLNIVQQINNTLEKRIAHRYGIRISNSIVEMLQKYYKNETDITADEIDAGYQVFIRAGGKANYYKTDEEIKQLLPDLAEKIRQETNIAAIVQYADEYFIWSEHLQLDTRQIKNEYKDRLISMIYNEVMKGVIDYLTFGVNAFHMQSSVNQSVVKDVCNVVTRKVIIDHIKYLSENTQGDQAFQYSYNLRKFMDNVFFQNDISGNVDSLYNEKSFPIYDVTEQRYWTAYNIMYVLYHENKDRLLDYCKELKTHCDNMATHRIDVILEEITSKK